MAKMTCHLELKVADDGSLTRSQTGAIWGRVYFGVRDAAFPDTGWTDLVAGFLTAWLEALTRIANGSKRKARVWFMDGPFAVDISASGENRLQVTFLHKEAVAQSVEANLRDVLENAVAVSKQVIVGCKRRGWETSDISSLEEAVEEAANA